MAASADGLLRVARDVPNVLRAAAIGLTRDALTTWVRLSTTNVTCAPSLVASSKRAAPPGSSTFRRVTKTDEPARCVTKMVPSSCRSVRRDSRSSKNSSVPRRRIVVRAAASCSASTPGSAKQDSTGRQLGRLTICFRAASLSALRELASVPSRTLKQLLPAQGSDDTRRITQGESYELYAGACLHILARDEQRQRSAHAPSRQTIAIVTHAGFEGR